MSSADALRRTEERESERERERGRERERDMAAGVVANLVASALGLFTAVTNFFTDVFLTPPLKATLQHLEETELQTLGGGETDVLLSTKECVDTYCNELGESRAVVRWERVNLLLHSFTSSVHQS